MEADWRLQAKKIFDSLPHTTTKAMTTAPLTRCSCGGGDSCSRKQNRVPPMWSQQQPIKEKEQTRLLQAYMELVDGPCNLLWKDKCVTTTKQSSHSSFLVKAKKVKVGPWKEYFRGPFTIPNKIDNDEDIKIVIQDSVKKKCRENSKQ